DWGWRWRRGWRWRGCRGWGWRGRWRRRRRRAGRSGQEGRGWGGAHRWDRRWAGRRSGIEPCDVLGEGLGEPHGAVGAGGDVPVAAREGLRQILLPRHPDLRDVATRRDARELG